MSLEADINTIQSYLSAWHPSVIKAALKKYAINGYKAVKEDGWQTWGGSKPPADSGWSGEWMLANGIYFVRDPDPSRYTDNGVKSVTKSVFQSQSSRRSVKVKCPWCGEDAYAQPVCGSCAKGKAGIKTQYLCGSGDPLHAFYTD